MPSPGEELSTDEEDAVHGQMKQYEDKIDTLMSHVGTLKNEVRRCCCIGCWLVVMVVVVVLLLLLLLFCCCMVSKRGNTGMFMLEQ